MRFSQSQPLLNHRRILAQIEDGRYDEPFAVNAVENAVREPAHEETPEFTSVTRRGLGKLRGDSQRAPHGVIKTITQARHQFFVACPCLE